MGRSDRALLDAHMMRIALMLARRGLGTTAPNPSVGAVVADETTGEVIARATTARGGRPHAEMVAVGRAGARARGATLYVTLEPCAHFGNTPPCADAIVAAGIRRVVASIEDPDPRVAGRGLERLRQAGIAVERGLNAAEAHWLARGHIVRVTERRPFVQVKVAVGPDGSVPRGSGGRPVWATGTEARARGHLLRAEADAVLVGRQTVIDDDPLLTCRLPGLRDRSPIRVVLSSRAEGIEGSRLAATAGETPVWVMAGPGADSDLVARLEASGCRVFKVITVEGRLWLPAVMETLAAEGITRLLVEGGSTVWQSCARGGLIDEVVLFHARPDGRERLSEREALRALRHLNLKGFTIAEHRSLLSDDILVLRKGWRGTPLDEAGAQLGEGGR